MPSLRDVFQEKFGRTARAARKADAMARDIDLSRTLWDEPGADAVQAKLDGHLDEHRAELETHPQWISYYTEKDWTDQGHPTWKHLDERAANQIAYEQWQGREAGRIVVVPTTQLAAPRLHTHTAAERQVPALSEEAKEAHAKALAFQASFFHKMDLQNTPIFDHEEGEFTNEYRDIDTSQSEERLDAHLKANRQLLEDHPEWSDWYKLMDRAEQAKKDEKASESTHLRQRDQGRDLGLER